MRSSNKHFSEPRKFKRTTMVPAGQRGFRRLWWRYKADAAKKKPNGVPFLLTETEFKELTSATCYYCGAPPSQISIDQYASTQEHGKYLYNGLDRVDTSQGYLVTNVRTCCKTCNRMKSDIAVGDFLAKIKQIHDFLKLSCEAK